MDLSEGSVEWFGDFLLGRRKAFDLLGLRQISSFGLVLSSCFMLENLIKPK